jgi:hypothetical protein
MIAAAVGLTSCGRSPSPPATVVVVDPSDSMKVADPGEVAKNDPAPLTDGGSFPFPDDAGGKALAKTLAPAAPAPAPMPAAVPAAPRKRRLPAYLDLPTPPLPDAASSPPRLALPPTRQVRPIPLPDRVPLDLGGVVPDLPGRPDLPIGSLTRTESRDVSRPADLPVLSPKPVPDRAPLADPTAEFTAASVISPTLPLRTEPAGFIRINLPDPFENADSAKVRTPVVEDPNRVLASPPPPRAP